jgi:hypothetical protein
VGSGTRREGKTCRGCLQAHRGPANSALLGREKRTRKSISADFEDSGKCLGCLLAFQSRDALDEPLPAGTGLLDAPTQRGRTCSALRRTDPGAGSEEGTQSEGLCRKVTIRLESRDAFQSCPGALPQGGHRISSGTDVRRRIWGSAIAGERKQRFNEESG